MIKNTILTGAPHPHYSQSKRLHIDSPENAVPSNAMPNLEEDLTRTFSRMAMKNSDTDDQVNVDALSHDKSRAQKATIIMYPEACDGVRRKAILPEPELVAFEKEKKQMENSSMFFQPINENEEPRTESRCAVVTPKPMRPQSILTTM